MLIFNIAGICLIWWRSNKNIIQVLHIYVFVAQWFVWIYVVEAFVENLHSTTISWPENLVNIRLNRHIHFLKWFKQLFSNSLFDQTPNLTKMADVWPCLNCQMHIQFHFSWLWLLIYNYHFYGTLKFIWKFWVFIHIV